ncbi:hypothetical protein EIN_078260 [Entamoeba invadens IP1]|uniref:Uncharacterized protein n=1 Tax=Entamoeba invadens IP1 TaxID=370355 RepID=A0A0A1TUD4_ENTIV|nr:hypothetical protein EIN_078260 [Entamoeba invadens IP1]ELP83591.1 hypothetical protein EIN_078260 [Entamoeba invadens IP1]|eukprot:XP_004182937.1 hypothetical protein EIN_078260 [Entamoeba invadens IP1]
MSRLEMIYLMQVSLYLPTLSDVYTFIQVNHCANSAVTSLKVNPWFALTQDIEKFYDLFHPDTLNCNFLPISFDYLLKPIYIRNYIIEGPPEMIEKITPEICEKMTSLNIMRTFVNKNNTPQKLFQMIIETFRQKITMSINYFIYFIDFFEQYETRDNFKKIFPKNVYVNFDMNFGSNAFGSNAFGTTTNGAINIPFNKINELPLKYATQIDIDWTNSVSSMDKITLTQNCRNYSNNISIEYADYLTPFIRDNSLTFQTKNLTQISDLHKVEKIIGKSVATKVTFMGGVCDLSLLQIPKYVKSISLKNGFVPNSFGVEHKQTNFVILPDVLNSEEFVSEGVNFQFSEGFNTVKKVEMTTAKIVKKKRIELLEKCNKKRIWENKQQFPFANVEELKLVNFSDVCYEQFKTLQKLSLLSVRNVELFINKECAKNITCTDCSNCILNIDCESCETFEFNMCPNFTFNFLNTKNTNLTVKIINSLNSKISSETDFIKSLSVYDTSKFEISKNTKIGKLVISNSTLKKKVGVEAEEVVFGALLEYVDIDFTHTKSVLLFNIENFIFSNTFDKCEIVKIEYCRDCDFIFGDSKIEQLGIFSSKAIDFKGNFNFLQKVENLDSTFTFPSDFNLSKHIICLSKLNESETCEFSTLEKYEEVKQKCLTKDDTPVFKTSPLGFPKTTVPPNQNNFNLFQTGFGNYRNSFGFTGQPERRNIFDEVVDAQQRNCSVNPTLPPNVTTESVTINSHNFIIKNCVCTALSIEQHVDFIPNLKIENFIGEFPNFSTSAFGRIEMKNCNFVASFEFQIKNLTLNVVKLKIHQCTNFSIGLMSKTKEVDIVESNGYIIFSYGLGNFNRLNFERSQIQTFNNSGLYENVNDLCFDSTEFPSLFEKRCVNNLVMKNIDNIPYQIAIMSKSATFENCKNLVITVGNETEHVVLKMCKRCFVMWIKPEIVTQIKCDDVEIFDGMTALTQRLNQVRAANVPQQNQFGAPTGFAQNAFRGGFGFN